MNIYIYIAITLFIILLFLVINITIIKKKSNRILIKNVNTIFFLIILSFVILIINKYFIDKTKGNINKTKDNIHTSKNKFIRYWDMPENLNLKKDIYSKLKKSLNDYINSNNTYINIKCYANEIRRILFEFVTNQEDIDELFTREQSIFELLNSSNKLSLTYKESILIDSKDPNTFKNNILELKDYKDYLKEVKENENTNNRFDYLTYLFGIITLEYFKCKNGLHENKIIQGKYTIHSTFQIKALDQKEKKFSSVQDFIDKYNLNEESLDEENEYKHNYCESKDTIKNIKIIPIAKYFILNIVNYNYDEPKSKEFKIKPKDLQELIESTLKIKENGKTYYLRAMVCHLGRTINSGHYTIYKNLNIDLKKKDNIKTNWYDISDLIVKPVNIKEIFNYFTNPDSWSYGSVPYLMYELPDSETSVLEDIDNENTTFFDSLGWKTQRLGNKKNMAVGLKSDVNGCFFNSFIQLIFSNRHLVSLILNSNK